MNELVTNAIKYAFPKGKSNTGEEQCSITVTVQSDGVSYILTVSDNGVGLPEDMDWPATESLGLRLVSMLGERQLRGTIELDRTGGTTLRLNFEPRIKQ